MIKDAKVESVVILERYLAYSVALDINKEYDTKLFNDLEDLLKFNLITVLEENLNIDLSKTQNLEK